MVDSMSGLECCLVCLTELSNEWLNLIEFARTQARERHPLNLSAHKVIPLPAKVNTSFAETILFSSVWQTL